MIAGGLPETPFVQWATNASLDKTDEFNGWEFNYSQTVNKAYPTTSEFITIQNVILDPGTRLRLRIFGPYNLKKMYMITV